MHGEQTSIIFAEHLSNKVVEAKKFITCFTNFVKYEDPNYNRSTNDKDYWDPFFDDSISLIDETERDIKNDRNYLLITNRKVSMTEDYSKHH